jgi:mannose-6-phosphate isomerase-like protein (cupin superfamily)
MNPEITTLDPVATSSVARTLLSRDGVNCTLLTLAPGDETPFTDSTSSPEQVLFVAEGQVTVRFGGVNTLVNQEEAYLLPAGRPYSLAASRAGNAKVLRVALPPRQVVAPLTYPAAR